MPRSSRPYRRVAQVLALMLLTVSTGWSIPLRINTTPAGATVITETGERLTSPVTVDLRRRTEPYSFIIERAGYQSETASWNTRERVREIHVTLEPLQTQEEVTIRSNPAGAAVSIDGQAAGVTPLVRTTTFFRDTKNSPWKPATVTLTLADHQTETFPLPHDRRTIEMPLAQLRIERSFNIETRTADGSPIQATVTLQNSELGPAPRQVPVVFTRTDKTRPWPTFNLGAEIATIYHPTNIVLTYDYADSVPITLAPITELSVPLHAPVVEITPTGARMTVNLTPTIGTLDASEQGAEVTSLSRLTRFARRDQNPAAPLQAINSYTITPDGGSAILSLTSQDDAGRYFSALFLKRVEDDGGGLARLVDSNQRYLDAHPIIAPDSNNILVFQSNRGDLSKPDVFRIDFTDNRTSGGVSRITNDQRFNYGPTYTDSNREIVYLSVEPNYPQARPQLSTVKFDGALPTQFQTSAEEVSHREPSKIYFTRVDPSRGKRQIYSVETDGRLETNLLSDDSFHAANCFNPVASFSNPVRILFVSDRDVDAQGRPNNNIYVMNADGSQIRQLTTNGSNDILPSWSPTDPNVLYFLSNRGGVYNLWRLRLK